MRCLPSIPAPAARGRRPVVSLVLMAVLVACGGGSGGTDPGDPGSAPPPVAGGPAPPAAGGAPTPGGPSAGVPPGGGQPTAPIGTWRVAVVDAGDAGPNALTASGVLAYTSINRLLGPRANVFDDSLRALPRIPAQAFAVNDAGIVAGELDEPERRVAMRWASRTDEAPSRLDLEPGIDSVASAINADGVIAATLTRRGVDSALRWVSGPTARFLPVVGAPPQTSSRALFINGRGEIAGLMTVAGAAPHAAFWRPDDSVVDLGTLGGGESSPAGLNEAGQVAGRAQTAPGDLHAFLWSEATGMRDLGTLGGPTSAANGLNASGWVVGTADTPAPAAVAFLWRDGAMRALGTLGGRASAAAAVNASGLVGGNSETSTGVQHAFVWTEAAGMVDLNTVVSGGEPLPGVLQTVIGVSDDGSVLATAEGGVVVLLRPVRPS